MIGLDDTVNMIRPHLNDIIPQVTFPPGYSIRPMNPGDVELWTDIQREAEPYQTINDSTFGSEFGNDPETIRQRCFIVTDPHECGVGVVGAWYNRDFRGRDYGRIHWIAIRPAWQGQGLGKATLSYAMQRLAQWHERAYLVTHTRRIVAVKMYLRFGFEPDLIPPNAFELWRNVAESIQHPVLERALKRCGVDN